MRSRICARCITPEKVPDLEHYIKPPKAHPRSPGRGCIVGRIQRIYTPKGFPKGVINPLEQVFELILFFNIQYNTIIGGAQ